MSSFPTDSIIFQDGYCTTNQVIINHHEPYNDHILTIINSLYEPHYKEKCESNQYIMDIQPMGESYALLGGML